MRKAIACLVLLTLTYSIVASAAVRGKEVMYVGGTVDKIPERTKGRLDRSDREVLVFRSTHGEIRIPYDRITSLEYGQKAGRRLGVAIAVTLLALLSKKRKHFLTIGYEDDEDVPQGVVFEIPKKLTKVIIVTVEVRSGMKCDYESAEARKHVHG